MKIHRITKRNGSWYTTHCGREICDPDRECVTDDPERSTCVMCNAVAKFTNPGGGWGRGFQKKIPCPRCGRKMSPASMVKHLAACKRIAREVILTQGA